MSQTNKRIALSVTLIALTILISVPVAAYSYLVSSKVVDQAVEVTTDNKLNAYAAIYEDTMIFDRDTENEEPPQTYDGKTLTTFFSNIEEITEAPWSEYSEPVETVTINTSITPLTTKEWFADMPSLKVVDNLQNIDVSNLSDMSGMFKGSSQLKTLYTRENWNLSGIDTQDMFLGCESVVGGLGAEYDGTDRPYIDLLDSYSIQSSKWGATSGYNNNESQTWTLKRINKNQPITIKFGDGCKTENGYDYIQIWAGKTTASPTATGSESGKLSGISFSGKEYSYDCEDLTITWRSDSGTIYAGFYADIENATIVNTTGGASFSYSDNSGYLTPKIDINYYGIDGALLETVPYVYGSLARLCDTEYGWTDTQNGDIKYLSQEIVSYSVLSNNINLHLAERPKIAYAALYGETGDGLTDDLSLIFGKKCDIPETYEDKILVNSWKGIEDNFVASYNTSTSGGINTWNSANLYKTIKEIKVVDKIQPKNLSKWFGSYSSSATYNNKLSATFDLRLLDTSSVTDMNQMFYYCSNLTQLDLSSFDTSSVTSMYQMFYNCSKLIQLDLSSFDTSNVTNMSQMFYNCSSLTSIEGIGSWDTSNVKNMSGMFRQCSRLLKLDLSNFNTSNVTNMSYMFDCSSFLTSLDVSSFNTFKVTDMSNMFSSCGSLTSLDLSSFDTSNVTNMIQMFSCCSQTKTIIVSSLWDVKNVASSNGMFYGCYRILGGNHSNIYNSLMTNKEYANIGLNKNNNYLTPKTFIQYHDLDGNPIGELEEYRYNIPAKNALIGYFGWKTSYTTFRPKETLVYDFDHPFNQIDLYPATEDEFVETSYAALYGADEDSNTSLSLTFGKGLEIPKTFGSKRLVVSWTNIENNVNGSYNYWNDIKTYKSLSSVKIIDKIQPTNTAYWFYNNDGTNTCSSIVGLKNLDTSNVTDMHCMFCYSKVSSLDLSDFDTSKVTNMGSMFYGCQSIWSLDLSSFDTSKVTNMGSMFYNTNLTSINVSNFDTSNVKNMSDMFSYCKKISSLELNNWDTSNVVDMSRMFLCCSSLVSLDLSSWDTSNVTNMYEMFQLSGNNTWGGSLKTIYISDLWNLDNVTNKNDMFYCCTSLIGGNGFVYDKTKTNGIYACIDTSDTPGYLTPKTYIQYHDQDGNNLGDPILYKYGLSLITPLEGSEGWTIDGETLLEKPIYDFNNPFAQIDIYPIEIPSIPDDIETQSSQPLALKEDKEIVQASDSPHTPTLPEDGE